MAKFLKNIKSLFIEEIEEENKKVEANRKRVKAPQPSVPTTRQQRKTTETDATPPPETIKVDPKFVNMLMGAMERENLPGLDYLEFKQSLKNLNKMEMDEATRYKSAFAVAASMGATKEKLVQSASHYLKVLGEEEKKFLTALKKQDNTKVKTAENNIAELQKVIQQKEAMINQLQKEIKQLKEKVASSQKSRQAAMTKIQTTQAKFHRAYEAIQQQIARDVEQIQRYL